MTGPVPITYDPWQVVKKIIEDNFTLSGWSNPIVNQSWYETKRARMPQITMMPVTDIPTLSELDKTTSPVGHDKSYLLSVHARNRLVRWAMIREIRRIFGDPALTRNPTYDENATGIFEIFIEDESPNDFDKKKGIGTWRCDWTLRVLYGEEYA